MVNNSDVMEEPENKPSLTSFSYDQNVKALESGSSNISLLQFQEEWMLQDVIYFQLIFMKGEDIGLS